MLADAPTARDVLTFLGRAATISDDGVRLQASGGVLAVTAAALAPQGLFDRTPTVLAMRIVHADPELECDLVVDELGETDDDRMLQLPDSGRAPAWAGISAPRGGWERTGEIAASTIAERAQWGMAAVARGAGTQSGEEIVRSVRASVWGEPDPELGDLPRGVAFAAHAFGFVSGAEDIAVTVSGRWTRLAFRRGHVLSRGPAAVGLTPIRETGS